MGFVSIVTLMSDAEFYAKSYTFFGNT